MFGCFKARAVPINVNYRYVADELRYLFDNADLVALVYEARVRPARGERAPRPPPARAPRRARRRQPAPSPTSSPRSSTKHALASASPARARRPALRRRPLHPLHRRHHRHAQGRDVARRGHLLRRAGRRELRRPGHHGARSRSPTTSPRRPARTLALAPLMHGNAQWTLIDRALRRQHRRAQHRAAASTPTRSGTSSSARVCSSSASSATRWRGRWSTRSRSAQPPPNAVRDRVGWRDPLAVDQGRDQREAAERDRDGRVRRLRDRRERRGRRHRQGAAVPHERVDDGHHRRRQGRARSARSACSRGAGTCRSATTRTRRRPRRRSSSSTACAGRSPATAR